MLCRDGHCDEESGQSPRTSKMVAIGHHDHRNACVGGDWGEDKNWYGRFNPSSFVAFLFEFPEL